MLIVNLCAVTLLPSYPVRQPYRTVRLGNGGRASGAQVHHGVHFPPMGASFPHVNLQECASLESPEPSSEAAADDALVIRFGVSTHIGCRQALEDTYVAVADVSAHCTEVSLRGPGGRSFFGVFDGHNGVTAADYVSQHLLEKYIQLEDVVSEPSEALRRAFVATDLDLLQRVASGREEDSGTTALAVAILGNCMHIANAGDSRAVLSRRGKAVDLSSDHKPSNPEELNRIRLAGGSVCKEGFLGGHLSVARALGDYHYPDLKRLDSKGAWAGPLTPEPEVRQHLLQPEDEFMLIACDGLWDVMTSNRAIELARSRLREHNDPQLMAEELVAEALRMNSTDNVTVLAVCFRAGRPPKREYGRREMPHSMSRNNLNTISQALADIDASPFSLLS